MSVTATAAETLKTVLDQGELGKVASAIQKMKLGTMLTPTVYDTGTLNPGVADITLNPPALIVQSAHVVTSGTAGSVGTYIVGDSTSVPVSVAGGANAAPGVSKISTDGATITFANTVTRAIIVYLPRSNASMSDPLVRS